MNETPNIPNFNTFNSPVDASTGNPIIPTAETGDTLNTDETAPANLGYTSNENGYGTNAQAHSIERNDLDNSFYNAQMGQRVNELYANEEAQEKAADEAMWADKEAEDLAKQQAQNITNENPEPTQAKEETISEGNEKETVAREKLLENIKSAVDEYIAETTPDATITDKTETPATTGEDSTQPITNETEPSSSPRTMESTNLGNLKANATQKDVFYLGKDGLRYRTREEALASFRD